MNNVNVRFANKYDVTDMVSVHLESFPGFFLTFLGPRFLRVLYTNILGISDNISLVAVDDNRTIEGFAVGTLSPEGLYKRLLAKNWLDFALASIYPALRNPTYVPRLLRAFKAPKVERVKSADCLLMSIAVSPHVAGKGIGRQLLAEFLDVAENRGAQVISLTTDKENNEAVNQFYLNNGFELCESFATPEGRQMNEYHYTVQSNKTVSTKN